MIDQFIIGSIALGVIMSSCVSRNQKPTDSPVSITILQTADIHGQLEAHDELFWKDGDVHFKRLGGLASIKTLFDAEKAKNPEGTLILDGGDLIQGSAVAAKSRGEVFPDLIKAMSYDFLIPGNWEVVYGKQQMLRILKGYETPVIAANMYHDTTGDTLFPPYYIKTLKGVKLGFIGYNDPEVPIRQNPSFSEGIQFEQVLPGLEQLVYQLKNREEVDVLFLVTHLGISKQFDLANHPALAEVDYVLGNDTHERIRKPLQGKYARVTEPGAFGSFVGKLELTVLDGKVVRDDYQLIEVDPAVYPPNHQIDSLVEVAVSTYAHDLTEVLGYTKTPLYRYFVVENPMDNFITDAARWKTGVDISISNGFRFSPPLAVKGKPAPITRSYLYSMLPVDDYVKTGKASGQQIINWLEQELHHVFASNSQERFGGWLVRFSGLEVTFNANKSKGERLSSVRVNGESLQLDKLYTVSACRRAGEPEDMLCRMPGVRDVQVMDYTMHQALEDYLKAHHAIAPKIDGRARALDLGDHVLSQLPGTEYQFY